ncbi:MAG: TIGR00282 family metallophosphoesterase [Desulfomicrobium sp.]|nr:TIGR00282 family metallophosphoesterase [Desulfomicrobium sp.]
MRVLFLGDIVGKSGRQMVIRHLPYLRKSLKLDVVLANGENASGGLGLSAKSACELHRAGVDVLTTGNHVWKFPDLRPILDSQPWILRPANYPVTVPGKGMTTHQVGDITLCIINIQGRTYMDPIECPFVHTQRLVADAPKEAVIVIDMHAEATSEKKALGHMLRGQVHAVLGTHTHVQTNDACILDGFTGYLTDLGMCGPVDSCLGMDSDIILKKFQTGLPQRFSLATGPCALNGALLELDRAGCQSISAWQWTANERI